MAAGTAMFPAGFTAMLTAMLTVMALEDHGLGPDAGEVSVTGAAEGGRLGVDGYRVARVTGRPAQAAYHKPPRPAPSRRLSAGCAMRPI